MSARNKPFFQKEMTKVILETLQKELDLSGNKIFHISKTRLSKLADNLADKLVTVWQTELLSGRPVTFKKLGRLQVQLGQKQKESNERLKTIKFRICRDFKKLLNQ